MSNPQKRSSFAVGCLWLLLLPIIAVPVIGFALLSNFLPCQFTLRPCPPKRDAEGKQHVRSMNRAQQAYHLENQKFSTTIEALGVGIKTRTQQYEYSVRTTPTSAFSYGVAIGNDALARPSYVGGVFIGKTKQGEDPTLAILCEFKGQEVTLTMKPTLKNGSPVCPEGSTQVKIY